MHWDFGKLQLAVSNGLNQMTLRMRATSAAFGGVAERTPRSSEDDRLSDGDFPRLSGDNCPHNDYGFPVRVQQC